MAITRHIFYEFAGYEATEGDALRTDPSGLGLSSEDLAELDRFSRGIVEDGLFQIGPNSISARQYAGVVVFGDKQFEILPKILKAQSGDRRSILKNLLWMLQCTPEIWPLSTDDADLDASRGSFLELAIFQFAKTVCKAISQGVPQLYVNRDDNLNRPKGRIDFRENIRLNSWNESRLACRFSEITYDHILLQSIRFVLRIFHRLAHEPSVRMAVSEALAKTGEITDRQVSYSEIERIPVPQSNPAFVAAIETTKLVLSGLRIEATGGRQKGLAFVFDMNELFERYFSSLLIRYKARLGLAEVAIQKRRALVERIYDVRANQVVGGTMATFTDLLVKTQTGRSIVMDTKYKMAAGEHQFHAGVSNADAYQILAYQGLYMDTTRIPDGVLVYPESFRPAFFRFELRGGRCFYMKTISLSTDLTSEEPRLIEELKRFFEGLESSPPNIKRSG